MNAFRRIASLNTVGVIVLVIGMSSAVLVYRLGQNRSANSTTNSEWKDGSLALTDSKTSTRDIELYGGKLEVLMVKWLEWLQHPESLAIIIAAVATLIALGCFIAARSSSPDS